MGKEVVTIIHIKLWDKQNDRFVDDDDILHIGLDGKVYEIYAADLGSGAYLDREDVSERYDLYIVGVDMGR